MTAVELYPTRCAICQTEGNATELYPANFDLAALTPSVFSARRLPDRLHYRLVKCQTCGLVRSDPVPAPGFLAQLYAASHFDYAAEVAHLRRTYGRYLAKTSRPGQPKGALLEIGCGNGFFIEEALAQGYRDVRGVEPSREAVAQAPADIRDLLVCAEMRPGLFPPGRFDVICMFQVFDHIADPGGLLDLCRDLLKPGGVVLCLNHDVAAWSARWLGERSPIIDIEHTYLYQPATLRRLLAQHGFEIQAHGAAINQYSVYYVARLLPWPARLKRWLLAQLEASRLGRAAVWVPLGNLYVIAQKPAEPRVR